MRLLIIRHAESANNRIAINLDYDDYMRTRSPDPGITELGIEQTRLLAQHIAGAPSADSPDGARGCYGITHLYASPMLRTLQTAAPLAAALGLPATLWVEIHEHGGMFQGNPRNGDGLVIHPGLSRQAIQAGFPGFVVPNTVTDAGWWSGGYEDMAGCYGRAIRVARELRHRADREAEEHISSCVAIVSHGTFIDSLLKALMHQIPDRGIYYFHNNTALTCVDFGLSGTVFLRYLNRIAHLPAELISE
jgi:broad specificity phosphatase PhoE